MTSTGFVQPNRCNFYVAVTLKKLRPCGAPPAGQVNQIDYCGDHLVAAKVASFNRSKKKKK